MAKPSQKSVRVPKASALDIVNAVLAQHCEAKVEYPDRWTEEMKFLAERVENLRFSMNRVCEAIDRADQILDDDNIVGGINEEDAVTAGSAVMSASDLMDHCWEEMEIMENRLNRLDAATYSATEDEGWVD